MEFKDLNFTAHTSSLGGVHATVFFENGFGASVIRTPFSYGGREGLYELAVLKGTKLNSSLTYDTEITDDVLGYLTEDDVTKYLQQIRDL